LFPHLAYDLENEEGGKEMHAQNLESSSPSRSPIGKVPIRRRILLSKMRNITMQYREPRSPIVISESKSSEEPSEDDRIEIPGKSASSQVVAKILGRDRSHDSEDVLFNDSVDVGNDLEGNDPMGRQGEPDVEGSNSPAGFQEKEKSKDLSKKEKDKQARKDVVSKAQLAPSKIKEIYRYTSCDGECLRNLGVDLITKHRMYYYGLTNTEKNILLRGCMEDNHRGRTGYNVHGRPICRTGFKKIYSVGNDRIQRVSRDIFSRIRNDTFRKEKSTTHLSLVQWLNRFFATNVESLPNKDIFHLPDNWTKLEVFEAFRNEFLFREEASATYSWFCRIWNLEFPRVQIPKRSRFSTCAPCTEFKALR